MVQFTVVKLMSVFHFRIMKILPPQFHNMFDRAFHFFFTIARSVKNCARLAELKPSLLQTIMCFLPEHVRTSIYAIWHRPRFRPPNYVTQTQQSEIEILADFLLDATTADRVPPKLSKQLLDLVWEMRSSPLPDDTPILPQHVNTSQTTPSLPAPQSGMFLNPNNVVLHNGVLSPLFNAAIFGNNINHPFFNQQALCFPTPFLQPQPHMPVATNNLNIVPNSAMLQKVSGGRPKIVGIPYNFSVKHLFDAAETNDNFVIPRYNNGITVYENTPNLCYHLDNTVSCPFSNPCIECQHMFENNANKFFYAAKTEIALRKAQQPNRRINTEFEVVKLICTFKEPKPKTNTVKCRVNIKVTVRFRWQGLVCDYASVYYILYDKIGELIKFFKNNDEWCYNEFSCDDFRFRLFGTLILIKDFVDPNSNLGDGRLFEKQKKFFLDALRNVVNIKMKETFKNENPAVTLIQHHNVMQRNVPAVPISDSIGSSGNLNVNSAKTAHYVSNAEEPHILNNNLDVLFAPVDFTDTVVNKNLLNVEGDSLADGYFEMAREYQLKRGGMNIAVVNNSAAQGQVSVETAVYENEQQVKLGSDSNIEQSTVNKVVEDPFVANNNGGVNDNAINNVDMLQSANLNVGRNVEQDVAVKNNDNQLEEFIDVVTVDPDFNIYLDNNIPQRRNSNPYFYELHYGNSNVSHASSSVDGGSGDGSSSETDNNHISNVMENPENTDLENFDNSDMENPDNSGMEDFENSGMENPENTVMENPENTDMENFEDSFMENPENTDMENFENSGMEDFENSGMENFEDSFMENPETTDMENFENSGMEDFENSGMENPENTDMENFENSGMEDFENTVMENPETTDMENFENNGMENFENSGMENPENTDMENFENSGMEDFENTVMENPETTDMENFENSGMEDFENSGMENPENTDMENFENSGMEDFENTVMENTENTDMENFEDSFMENPENTDIEIFENSGMENPENINMDNPENTDMENFENSGMENPENTVMENPENTDMENFENSGMENPENPDIEIFENSGMENPENINMENPENTDMENFESVEIVEPIQNNMGVRQEDVDILLYFTYGNNQYAESNAAEKNVEQAVNVNDNNVCNSHENKEHPENDEDKEYGDQQEMDNGGNKVYNMEQFDKNGTQPEVDNDIEDVVPMEVDNDEILTNDDTLSSMVICGIKQKVNQRKKPRYENRVKWSRVKKRKRPLPKREVPIVRRPRIKRKFAFTPTPSPEPEPLDYHQEEEK